VPRAEDLSDTELLNIAARGLDDDDPANPASRVHDLTSEDWVARYAPRPVIDQAPG
jgi:hypothetical protein